MSQSGDAVGPHGEQLAAEYLREQGWTIRDRNVEWKIGELDIVAARDGTIAGRSVPIVAFVEVKTRSSAGVPPEANVTRRKRNKLTRLGELYLDAKDLRDVSARFDIVTVQLGDSVDISHYPAAFDARGRFN